MNAHGLVASTLTVAALAMPCGALRVPSDVPGIAHLVKEGGRRGSEFVEENQRCEALRTTPVALAEEEAVGQTAALEIIREGGLRNEGREDPALRALNRLGVSLALLSERPSLEWTFGILEDDGVNAFAMPGGYVFVTRGLLRQVENEAQLAGVLAHEIAHVTEQHALEHYRPLKANLCTVSIGTDRIGQAAGGVDLRVASLDFNDAKQKVLSEWLEDLGRGLVEKISSLGYPAEEEIEADRGAVSLMIAAGYQPAEYRKFLTRLPEAKNLRNHPPLSQRVESVDALLKALEKDPLRKAGHPFEEGQGYRAPPLSEALAQGVQRTR